MAKTNAELRKEKRSVRNALEPDRILDLSQNIIDNIFDSDILDGIKRIMCFYPLNSEVDLRPMYESLIESGYDLFFPKTYGKTMDFYRVTDLKADFEVGNFNVMEPRLLEHRLEDFSYTLCFTPGLVFDKNGNRIGYGAGFYDRFFELYSGILKVGVCFEVQLSNEIVPEAHDVPLDYVVTENHIYKRRQL